MENRRLDSHSHGFYATVDTLVANCREWLESHLRLVPLVRRLRLFSRCKPTDPRKVVWCIFGAQAIFFQSANNLFMVE